MPYIGNNHIAGDHTNNFKVLDDISSYTATFDGSASSVVDTTNNTIRVVEHRFIQGQRVTYTNGGGGNIGGLTTGTAYFVIFDSASTFKLATSASNAANSVAINLSSVGTGSSHTLNAAFDGVNTKFKVTYNGGTGARFNNATQLNIAINNVLQKPNVDSTTFTEGFAIEDNHKIVFKVAPTANDIFWGSIIANTLTTFDISDHKIDTFTGDGSTTEFTLSHTPANNESLMVTINGVLQHPSNASTARAYTLIANVIQFTAAPGVGDEIQVRHMGFAGATTADVSGFYGRTGNVVLTSNDHITTGNINAGIVTATSFDGTFSSSVGGSNANFTGIVTAGTFKGGNIDAVDGAFSGNVTIGGTLTYEDVTNIDSVGLVTARDGIFVPDDKSIRIGNTFANPDLKIFSSPTYEQAVIDYTRSGIGRGLRIRSTNTQIENWNGLAPIAKFVGGVGVGHVELNYAGDKKFETTTKGIQVGTGVTIETNGQAEVAGITTFYKDVHIKTSTGRLYVGATDRISLIADPSHSYLRINGGHFQIHNNNFGVRSYDGNGQTVLIYAPTNDGSGSGGVQLYHNNGSGINPKRFQTTNQGIEVLGHSELDNVNIVGVTTMSGDLTISNTAPSIYLTDTNHDSDFRILNQNGTFKIYDQTNGADRLEIFSGGTVAIDGNLDANAGIDVTGNANVSGDLDVDGHTNLDNVSIAGVTTISNNLTVTSAAPQIFLTDTNANSDYAIVVNTGQFRVRDETNGVNRFYIESDGTSKFAGNVDALAGLDVTGNITATDNVTITKTGDPILTITGSGHPQLTLTNTSGSDHTGINFGDSADFNAGMIQYSNSIDAMQFHAGGEERLRINSDGNIGINNTNPQEKVQIAGNISLGNRIDNTSRYIGKGTNGSGGVIGDASANANSCWIGFVSGSSTGDEDQLRFGTHKSGSSGGEVMRLDGLGRMSLGKHGIGTHNDASEYIKIQSNDTSAVLSIIGSNNTHSTLALGDEDDFNRARIRADHTNDLLGFWTADAERLRITDKGVLSSFLNTSGSGNNTGNAYYHRPVLEITHNPGTPATQIKITTNIPWSGDATHAHSVRIAGFRYGGRDTVDLQICWHIYNNEFFNRVATSSGSYAPTITLAVENNKVVIHLSNPGYWPKFYVESLYHPYGSKEQGEGWYWSDNAISGDSGLPVNTVPYKWDAGGLSFNDDHNNNGQGDLTINDGNLVLASGHGINFSSTSNGSGASGISELLDDYEFGDFTPTIHTNTNKNSTSGENDSHTGSGQYTKVGKMVTVTVDFNALHTNARNHVLRYISGLPFASRSNNKTTAVIGYQRGLHFVYGGDVFSGQSGRYHTLYGYIGGNSTNLQLNGSMSYSPYSGWPATHDSGSSQYMRITISYFTS